MNRLAHALFPANLIGLVDIIDAPKLTAFVKTYGFATASWLSWLNPSFALVVLMILGGIIPDSIDKAFSNHKRVTHLQHRKDSGEWLSDEDFHEMVHGKKDWWAIHRTFSHWWPIPIALYFLGLQPLALGWASHLLLDAMTPMGIPKLAPMPTDKESGYMRIPYLSEIRGLSELTTVALVGSTACLFYFM